MGSHKVGHDWSDLAAAAAAEWVTLLLHKTGVTKHPDVSLKCKLTWEQGWEVRYCRVSFKTFFFCIKTWGFAPHTGTKWQRVTSKQEHSSLPLTTLPYSHFLRRMWNVFPQQKVNCPPGEARKEGWRLYSSFSALPVFQLWEEAHLEFLSYTTHKRIQDCQDGVPHSGGKTNSHMGVSRCQLLPCSQMYLESDSVAIPLPSLKPIQLTYFILLKGLPRWLTLFLVALVLSNSLQPHQL